MKLSKVLSLSTLSLLLSFQAFAGILTPELSDKTLEGVKLDKSATFNSASGSPLQVYTVGAALRSKKIAILPVKVYVGQLLVSEPGKFSRNEQSLASVAAMPASAMQLTFLRTVGSSDLVKAFSDAFTSNQLAGDNPVVKQVLDFAKNSGDFESGKTLVVTSESQAGGKEVVTLENTKGGTVTINGGTGTIATVMSLWLGTLPANDDGLQKFKRELISGANL